MSNKEGLLNYVGNEEKVYLDLSTMQIVLTSDIKASRNLVMLPYRDELCSHSDAMISYLREYNISIPKKVRAMEYLEKLGRRYDFYDFWNTLISEAFDAWLEDIGLTVAQINISYDN